MNWKGQLPFIKETLKVRCVTSTTQPLIGLRKNILKTIRCPYNPSLSNDLPVNHLWGQDGNQCSLSRGNTCLGSSCLFFYKLAIKTFMSFHTCTAALLCPALPGSVTSGIWPIHANQDTCYCEPRCRLYFVFQRFERMPSVGSITATPPRPTLRCPSYVTKPPAQLGRPWGAGLHQERSLPVWSLSAMPGNAYDWMFFSSCSPPGWKMREQTTF